MHYKESQLVLEEVKKAKRIIIMCHTGPDTDSVVSSQILKYAFGLLGKEADIYCKDRLGADINLPKPPDDVKIVEPNKINMSDYDLFFAPDVNGIGRLGFDNDFKFKGKIINIDHHDLVGFGDIRINDTSSGSTSAMVYYILRDWKIKLSKEILDLILISLLTDTTVFHYSIYGSSKIFKTVSELMEGGADYENALYFADQNYDLMVFKYWAEAINGIKIDKAGKFAYVVMPYEINKKYEKYGVRSRWVADEIIRKIKGTNFGITILEDSKGNTNVSIRTRTPGYYVIDLLKELGGGGHLTGGGAALKGLPFKKAIERVLSASRQYAKTHQTQS